MSEEKISMDYVLDWIKDIFENTGNVERVNIGIWTNCTEDGVKDWQSHTLITEKVKKKKR